MNFMQKTGVLAILLWAGLWVDARHRRSRRRERQEERAVIHEWEGEGGNVLAEAEPEVAPAST